MYIHIHTCIYIYLKPNMFLFVFFLIAIYYFTSSS